MKARFFPRALAFAALAAAAIAAVAGPVAVAGPAAAADANDFDYASWDSALRVGVDDSGRSTLHVTETLVARFPEADQNRGIVRGITETYLGASLDTTILSVRDEKGEDVPYEIEEDDDVLFLLIGDDTFQHGLTTYVIEYSMRDVVVATDKTNVDEFYWNLLPLDSTQDVENFAATILFEEPLAAHLAGSARCYQGPSGATAACASDLVGPADTGDGVEFTVKATDLTMGTGITVAVALDPGTVVQPAARIPNATTAFGPLAFGGLALLFGALSRVAVKAFRRKQARDTGIVIAQFDVPESLPPLVAAALLAAPKNVVPAEIVHLAVRGMLHIHDADTSPLLQRVPGAIAFDPLDSRTMDELFEDETSNGYVAIPRNSTDFGTRMRALEAEGKSAAEARGLLTRKRSVLATIVQFASVAAMAGAIGIAMWGFSTGRTEAALGGSGGIVLAVAGLVIGSRGFVKHLVHTREGAQQHEYLLGVKEFIRVAEADRFRMLQSYSGAERRDNDVIHLYEKLLPYAMLFGQEKEWGQVLEAKYAGSGRTPEWTSADSVAFAPMILAFSHATTTATNYQVAPAASSSAGGSFGGGFSGGGGGGGFSGGR